MRLLLAFFPFFTYLVVERLWGTRSGLSAGLAASLAMIAMDWLSRKGWPKALELGTAFLFIAFLAYFDWKGRAMQVMQVRLGLDLGLAAIALVSIAIKQPFTLQYARESAPREAWDLPEFMATNVAISAAWGCAFLALAGADILMLWLHDVPRFVPIAISVVSLSTAAKFTSRRIEETRSLSEHKVVVK